MHQFHIDIGDWSGDGHGMKRTFLIRSNMPLEYVREAYFAAQEKLPRTIWPTEFLDEYENQSITMEVYETAKEHGYDLLAGFDADQLANLEECLEYPQIDPELMLEYALWFIAQGNPELTLVPVKLDTLAFYGADEKGRHISFIGYALFGH